ncbi:MAG: ABC transporter permease [Oscillospiraceae bacterium]|nr:ABC transporter permease [Oscillospiraceae bacterium]
MSMRHFGTLFRKDLKDYLQNKNSLLMMLLPLFFALLYSVIFSDGPEAMPPMYLLSMTVSMSLCLLPTATLSMSIAEEREKNTLRTLVLSGVTAVEFLLSKALACLVMLTVVDTLIFAVVGAPWGFFPAFLLVTTLAGLCLEFLGGVIGLVSRDQMSTGTISAPLMLLLMIPSMLANVNAVLAAIARFSPVYAALQLFGLSSQNAMFSADALWYFGVLLVWTLLSLAAFWLVYKKRGTDN